MPEKSVVVHPHWVRLWACFIALGWLLPLHFKPWTTFHHDAWFAAASVLVAAPLVLRITGPWPVPRLAMVLALLACVPWLQWSGGQIGLPGSVWMSFAYLLGFCLVVACGARWEALAPGQLLEGLFLSLGIAAIASVWLQLRQWLVLDTGWEWWSMGGDALRPYANISQSNQAATFLCLGLGALAWGGVRRQIGWLVGLFAAAFLLFGVALSGSRTAYLGLALVVLAVWHWRHLWPDARTPWRVTALFVLLLAYVAGLDVLAAAQSGRDALSGTSAHVRLQIWALCLQALEYAPWAGYGWNQTALAQLRTLDVHPGGLAPFTSAHNLFLDLLVWCGIPLGLLITVATLAWAYRRFKAVHRPDQAVLVLVLLVVFNHSMLEFPLHYAFFLLPVGWMLGVLEVRIGGDVGRWFRVPRAVMAALYLSATALLGLIVVDYFPIEMAYRSLKLERAHIQIAQWETPGALVITHLSDTLDMVRSVPQGPLSPAELRHREQLTATSPDGFSIFYLAAAEALSGRPDQAVLWSQRFCKLSPPLDCVPAAAAWAKAAQGHPEMAAIAWPSSASVSAPSR